MHYGKSIPQVLFTAAAAARVFFFCFFFVFCFFCFLFFFVTSGVFEKETNTNQIILPFLQKAVLFTDLFANEFAVNERLELTDLLVTYQEALCPNLHVLRMSGDSQPLPNVTYSGNLKTAQRVNSIVLRRDYALF